MASLFKHILVPLDFTRKNAAALRFALNLARQNQSRVTLLHVIETIEYADDEEIAQFFDSLKKRARERLASYAHRFDEAGVSIAYNPKVEGIAARTDLVIDDLRVLLDMFPGSAAR